MTKAKDGKKKYEPETKYFIEPGNLLTVKEVQEMVSPENIRYDLPTSKLGVRPVVWECSEEVMEHFRDFNGDEYRFLIFRKFAEGGVNLYHSKGMSPKKLSNL